MTQFSEFSEIGEFREIQNSLDIRDCKWAQFDLSEFPKVKVKMNGVIQDSQDYENFIHNWRELYKRNTVFTLHFDTTDVGMVSIKYAFRMRSFIRELKSSYPRLLSKSYIEVNSRWVRFLLRFIFMLERPVADVHIYQENVPGHTLVRGIDS